MCRPVTTIFLEEKPRKILAFSKRQSSVLAVPIITVLYHLIKIWFRTGYNDRSSSTIYFILVTISICSIMSSLILLVVMVALMGMVASLTCTNYDSNMGATFDITDLFRTPEQPPYQVEDGDIPCTTNRVRFFWPFLKIFTNPHFCYKGRTKLYVCVQCLWCCEWIFA